MALKQNVAMAAFAEAGCIVIVKSLCEITNGWLALVDTAAGKRLATAVKGDNPLQKRQIEKNVKVKGVNVDIMALTAVNAAEVRHAVKWTAPMPCGVKGTSVGFADYFNLGDAFLTEAFAKKQMRPVLLDMSPAAMAAVGLNLMTALDTVTWSVLEAGYKDGYGACAAELKVQTENFHGFDFNADIYKALGSGYKTIGLDCSDKVDLSVEKLTDEQVEKRFAEFNDVFRAAVDASYLKVEFKVGADKVSFQPTQLHRIILEYGEAIMHIQNVFNTFLKSAPWEIDFEISLAKSGKTLTPEEHCLVANEMQRNGIKVAAFCLDAARDVQAVREDLQLHAEIAETYGYRLSIKNADMALENPSAAMKALKGKVHFKANNILLMSAVKLLAAQKPELYAKIAACVGAEPLSAEAICTSGACATYAQNYVKFLTPGNELAEKMKAYLAAHKDAYAEAVRENLEQHFFKRF